MHGPTQVLFQSLQRRKPHQRTASHAPTTTACLGRSWTLPHESEEDVLYGQTDKWSDNKENKKRKIKIESVITNPASVWVYLICTRIKQTRGLHIPLETWGNHMESSASGLNFLAWSHIQMLTDNYFIFDCLQKAKITHNSFKTKAVAVQVCCWRS